MLGCQLFKKAKKKNYESSLLSKAARMSSTYLKFRFAKIIFL